MYQPPKSEIIESNSQERILEMSSVQKGGFVDARGLGGQDPWAERACPDCEEQMIIYGGVGGGKDKGSFQKNFHMLKTYRLLEA